MKTLALPPRAYHRPSLVFRSCLLGVLLFFCLLQIGQSWLLAKTSSSFFRKTGPSILRDTADFVDEGFTNMASTNDATHQKLVLVRHARSEANEFMARPGNEWGDPTFRDDPSLLDARLAETGMKQVKEELLPKLESNPAILQDVDLVLVSPLTRTQQTFRYGVLPALKEQRAETMPPMLAQPLSTERVYTASDTGRSKAELAQEFPWVDWSLLDPPTDPKWWYHHDDKDGEPYQEWRPHGQGQRYAVPGEPENVFKERMKSLEEWIAARDERCILLVVHWGVIRYLAGGRYNAENCEVKVLEDWKPLHQQQANL